MTEFSATTPFRLVRRLAAVGQDAPSLYLLICAAGERDAVLAEIAAEVEIQLGLNLHQLAGSELQPENLEPLINRDASDLIVIALDRWLPSLVGSFDRNVVLLTAGGTAMLLADADVVERILTAAPNLRNRLTDILLITPDEILRGSPA
ncbi:MAG: hypothetical protein WCB12_12605 [Bryobacteraceae bacterium]